jgi:two-component system, LytTR family, sensor kinase
LKRTHVVLLHAGYWALYLALLVLMLGLLRLQFRGGAAIPEILFASPIGFVAIAPNLLAFYGAHAFVFPWFLERRRAARAIGAVLALAILATGLAIGFLRVALGPDQPVFRSGAEIAGLSASLIAVCAIHATIALVMRGFTSWYDDLRLKEELRTKSEEMETALVGAKLDPHFLFNTLNNVDVLIGKDPNTASDYLQRLSEILRYVLYRSRETRVPLADELAYVDRYVELERLRSPNPAFIDWRVAGTTTGLVVAPMTFIPFVENAIKHTPDRRVDGAVSIHFDIEGTRVSLSCRNTMNGRQSEMPDSGGIGNDLIRRRLSLLYPGRHTLTMGDDGRTYSAQLVLEVDRC